MEHNSTAAQIPPWYFDEMTIVNVFRIVLSIIAIFGHTFILLLFIRFQKLRQTQYNQFVLFLVLSDLLIAIGVFMRGTYAAYATSHGIRTFSPIICSIINNVIQTTGMLSNQMSILGITIDRFMAIYKPIQYAKNQNKYLFNSILVTSIIYASTSIFLTYFQLDISKLIPVCSSGAAGGPYSSILILICCPIISVIIFAMYIATLICLSHRLRHSQANNMSALNLQRKVLVSASLILLCYAIFWAIPFTFSLLGAIFNYDSTTKSFWSTLGGFGNAINSGCSVFVFLLKYPMIKECAINVFRKKRIGKISVIPTATTQQSTFLSSRRGTRTQSIVHG